MPIKKSIFDENGNKTADPPVTTPDFSFAPNDALAHMIVDAWLDADYRKALLARGADNVTVTPEAVKLATESVRSAGFQLKRAVVITEREYDNVYETQAPHEVVFVLPDRERVERRPGQSLTDTARLLMACTPNGI